MRYLVVFLMMLAPSAYAQGLSPAECAQIYATYQITPPQCTNAPDPFARAQNPFAAAPDPFANPQLNPIRGQNTLSGSIVPGGAVSQNNVFFANGGTALDNTAVAQIRQLAGVLNTPLMQNACLRLVGHSDSSGSAAINQTVGYERANAVRTALAQLIQRPARIEDVQSRGEDAPLPGFAPSSKWQRRVEIWARPCTPVFGRFN